ncbi:MAG: TfuA-like protein [Streptosporangiaceae bacterium]
MGVLRAVECRALGMTGSGWVYERYLSGEIDADAEVPSCLIRRISSRPRFRW